MNEFLRTNRVEHKTTQAAEGLPRLAWTLEEFEKLSELGFFGGLDRERERIELIDGELVPMQSKGIRHENVRALLLNRLIRLLPDGVHVRVEPGWRPGGGHYLEPDFMFCPASTSATAVSAAHVLLVIEVADTSERYDKVIKAGLYAKLGVREYWVINAASLETTVHLAPSETGYGDVKTLAADHMLVPLLVPELSVSLGQLDIRE